MPNYTILLIDYDPRSIEGLRAPLRRAGFRVEVATDGLSGIQRFHQLHPDLTLVEAMLPKKHGFDVCRELKGSIHGQNAAVFIVTAVYRGLKYRHEALHQHGCDEYLEKPLTDEALLEAVARHVKLPDRDAAWVEPTDPEPRLGPHDRVLSVQAVDDEAPGIGFELSDSPSIPDLPAETTVDAPAASDSSSVSGFNLVEFSRGLGHGVPGEAEPPPRRMPSGRAGGGGPAVARARPRPVRRPKPVPAPPAAGRPTHDQLMLYFAAALLTLLGVLLAWIVLV